MSDQQLGALEAELEKSLNAASVKVQHVRWIEDVDEEGEVIHIAILDELGIGEDAMVGVTWPAVNGRGKTITTQIINLALLEDVGAEKLTEMLAPGLKHSHVTLLQSDEEQE